MRRVFMAVFVLGFVLSIVPAITVEAQDHTRRARPAYPIDVGEKMLVFSGAGLGGDILNPFATSAYGYSIEKTHRAIEISLPVGTTLKRVLGDFVDQESTPGPSLTIKLLRVDNSNAGAAVVLRSFTTDSILSSSAVDFQQVVSNPLSHTVLQGWTYFIDVEWPSGTYSDLLVSSLKLIYEP